MIYLTANVKFQFYLFYLFFIPKHLYFIIGQCAVPFLHGVVLLYLEIIPVRRIEHSNRFPRADES